MRDLQERLVDRYRRASLQLLRIQDNLNELALAMRDMLDRNEPYPLAAWSAPLGRIRRDLDDALRSEAALDSSAPPDAGAQVTSSLAQFWSAFDRALEQSRPGGDAEREALRQIRDSLQPRRDAIASQIARRLVHNNEAGQRAAQQVAGIHARVQRNAYLFLAAMLALILFTGTLAIVFNRRLFHRITELSAQRSTLSRRLITAQEETLRSVSRELHDEFGQILTAIGLMARRTGRQAAARQDTELADGLAELQSVAQEALDKVRGLSQSLQPVILQESGLLATVGWYLPVVERQTGLDIHYTPPAHGFDLPAASAIHVFRVLQEALNNVVRHSGSPTAEVRIRRDAGHAILEVEDAGRGLPAAPSGSGVGLAGMRERARLIGGSLDLLSAPLGGTLVRLKLPLAAQPEPL
ncbi:MAG: sensor histidine kinase [Bryobacterales bacterium]|nr:sensor histidine kinase [Bryobacterales bacterium]